MLSLSSRLKKHQSSWALDQVEFAAFCWKVYHLEQANLNNHFSLEKVDTEPLEQQHDAINKRGEIRMKIGFFKLEETIQRHWIQLAFSSLVQHRSQHRKLDEKKEEGKREANIHMRFTTSHEGIPCNKEAFLRSIWNHWRDVVASEQRKWMYALNGVAKRFHQKKKLSQVVHAWKHVAYVQRRFRQVLISVVLKTDLWVGFSLWKARARLDQESEQRVREMYNARLVGKTWKSWKYQHQRRKLETIAQVPHLANLRVQFRAWRTLVLTRRRRVLLMNKVLTRMYAPQLVMAFKWWFQKAFLPWVRTPSRSLSWQIRGKRAQYLGFTNALDLVRTGMNPKEIADLEEKKHDLDLYLSRLFYPLDRSDQEDDDNGEKRDHHGMFESSSEASEASGKTEKWPMYDGLELGDLRFVDYEMHVFRKKVFSRAERQRIENAASKDVYRFESDDSSFASMTTSQSSEELESTDSSTFSSSKPISDLPEKDRVGKALRLLRKKMKAKKAVKPRQRQHVASHRKTNSVPNVVVDVQQEKKSSERLAMEGSLRESKAKVRARVEQVEDMDAFKHEALLESLDQIYDERIVDRLWREMKEDIRGKRRSSSSSSTLSSSTWSSHTSAFDRLNVTGYAKHENILQKLQDVTDLGRVVDLEARVHRAQPFAHLVRFEEQQGTVWSDLFSPGSNLSGSSFYLDETENSLSTTSTISSSSQSETSDTSSETIDG